MNNSSIGLKQRNLYNLLLKSSLVLKILQYQWLTTNKTTVFQNFIFGLFFTPEISKSVDDDTKDQVEDNDDDNEVE